MKTEALISLLAKHDSGISQITQSTQAGKQRWLLGLGMGTAISALMMLLLFGPSPRLWQDMQTQPAFWLKIFFPATLIALGGGIFPKVGTPGMPWKFWRLALLLPWLAAALLAIGVLSQVPSAQRADTIFGNTWHVCSASIALLSAPIFASLLWSMRSLAPTQLGWAGAISGLLAGAVGANIYALHCPELAVPFIAIWYGLGMLFWALVGAMLGPRLLRW
jgi:hypothetical protein